jgi:REP element-mobilizing transposase RayT
MGYRKYPIKAGCYYHIFNRGNNRQEIFIEERNYNYFYSKIIDAFDDTIKLICYCLMPNHYHLIAYPNFDEALEKAMQKIATGYSRAINKSYGRTGHLFEGPYQAKLVPNNNYLLHLSRYIHLNPLSAGLVDKIEDWKHSSYLVYTGKSEDVFIENSIVMEQFKSPLDYKEFVKSFSEESKYYLKDVLIE